MDGELIERFDAVPGGIGMKSPPPQNSHQEGSNRVIVVDDQDSPV
jgi:hypothetical protein